MFRLVAVALAALLALPAGAQNYPNKPIRMMVPYSTGSATDALARLVAQQLGEGFKQQVVVENQPGANGIPATNSVVQAPPDGYTLMMIAANHVVNPSLYGKLPYDTLRDITPILRIAFAPFILTVHPSVPVTDLASFIEYARARPKQLHYASPSNGAPAHLATELVKTQAGIDLVHVPYKAAAQAQTDLLGGTIPVMFVVASAAIPHIKSGKLRALGISSAQRSSAAPDIPTIAEAGLSGFDFISWIGLAGPAKLPPELVERVTAEVLRIIAVPEVRARIQGLGLEIAPMRSSEFAGYMAKDMERLGEVVRRAGARLD